MTILKTDIKLMSSQQLDDSDDGGGQMTGIEIVDGNVNNLFPDISPLDRVTGKVSMRKGFIAILTDNAETYYGAHMIISNPAQDNNVSVCMFTTENPYDHRVGARDRVESYVVQGTRFPGYLWGKHVAGTRGIAIIMEVGEELPDIGDVLYIEDSLDQSQYVRLTSVDSVSTVFGDLGTKQVVNCEISNPLDNEMAGYEPIDQYKTDKTLIYRTLVADAAKYYGVSRTSAALSKNDTIINVDSVYTQLVPSAQVESTAEDIGAGTVPTAYPSGSATITISTNINVAPGGSMSLPVPAMPGTLEFNAQGYYFHSDGAKIIYTSTGAEIGAIDHQSGVINFTDAAPDLLSGVLGKMTFEPAAGGLRLGNSKVQPIRLANRGYNYVTTLSPLPDPGSVVVDYMALGKWYRLTDDGDGVLHGVSGTGTINYVTGTVGITCGALPDADSALMYGWGSPIEYVKRGGKNLTSEFVIDHTVADGSISPNSLEITWWDNGTERTATDDGVGNIVGTNAGGSVIYSTGRVRFKPDYAPDSGSTLIYDYDKYDSIVNTQAVSNGANSFTLPSFPVKPGSLNILVDYSGHGYTFPMILADDGDGNIICTPAVMNLSFPLGHSDWTGSTSVTPLPIDGTINYATGEIYFSGVSTGTVKWVERVIKTETLSV